MRRVASSGWCLVAARTAKVNRCVTFDRVMGSPSRLGSSAQWAVSRGLCLSQARVSLTMDRHRGMERCLRPNVSQLYMLHTRAKTLEFAANSGIHR